jgi:hypothetical protein
MVSTAAVDASLPSWGHSRGVPILLGLVSVSSVASIDSSCTLFIYFDLLCKRFFSSPCIGSAVCSFIYKAGRKPVSRRNHHKPSETWETTHNDEI